MLFCYCKVMATDDSFYRSPQKKRSTELKEWILPIVVGSLAAALVVWLVL